MDIKQYTQGTDRGDYEAVVKNMLKAGVDLKPFIAGTKRGDYKAVVLNAMNSESTIKPTAQPKENNFLTGRSEVGQYINQAGAHALETITAPLAGAEKSLGLDKKYGIFTGIHNELSKNTREIDAARPNSSASTVGDVIGDVATYAAPGMGYAKSIKGLTAVGGAVEGLKSKGRDENVVEGATLGAVGGFTGGVAAHYVLQPLVNTLAKKVLGVNHNVMKLNDLSKTDLNKVVSDLGVSDPEHIYKAYGKAISKRELTNDDKVVAILLHGGDKSSDEARTLLSMLVDTDADVAKNIESLANNIDSSLAKSADSKKLLYGAKYLQEFNKGVKDVYNKFNEYGNTVVINDKSILADVYNKLKDIPDSVKTQEDFANTKLLDRVLSGNEDITLTQLIRLRQGLPKTLRGSDVDGALKNTIDGLLPKDLLSKLDEKNTLAHNLALRGRGFKTDSIKNTLAKFMSDAYGTTSVDGKVVPNMNDSERMLEFNKLLKKDKFTNKEFKQIATALENSGKMEQFEEGLIGMTISSGKDIEFLTKLLNRLSLQTKAARQYRGNLNKLNDVVGNAISKTKLVSHLNKALKADSQYMGNALTSNLLSKLEYTVAGKIWNYILHRVTKPTETKFLSTINEVKKSLKHADLSKISTDIKFSRSTDVEQFTNQTIEDLSDKILKAGTIDLYHTSDNEFDLEDMNIMTDKPKSFGTGHYFATEPISDNLKKDNNYELQGVNLKLKHFKDRNDFLYSSAKWANGRDLPMEVDTGNKWDNIKHHYGKYLKSQGYDGIKSKGAYGDEIVTFDKSKLHNWTNTKKPKVIKDWVDSSSNIVQSYLKTGKHREMDNYFKNTNPTYNGVLYREGELSPRVLSKLKKGDVTVNSFPFATSSNSEKSSMFRIGKGRGTRIPVKFVIDASDVPQYDIRTINSKEDEVLVKPKTKFIVNSVEGDVIHLKAVKSATGKAIPLLSSAVLLPQEN